MPDVLLEILVCQVEAQRPSLAGEVVAALDLPGDGLGLLVLSFRPYHTLLRAGKLWIGGAGSLSLKKSRIGIGLYPAL